MEHYICIGGNKIALTDKQVGEIRKSLGVTCRALSEVPAGETFKIGSHEFIVLEHADDIATVILKEALTEPSKFFSNSNNYDGSVVDRMCTNFVMSEICEHVGLENIMEFTVDLTSDDGLDDYGRIIRRCSLLTKEQYKHYVRILDNYKLDRGWWLATPHSTPTHESGFYVELVTPSGSVYYDHCGFVGGVVRPYCVFKSSILVS